MVNNAVWPCVQMPQAVVVGLLKEIIARHMTLS